jgi:hypothetical protein
LKRRVTHRAEDESSPPDEVESSSLFEPERPFGADRLVAAEDGARRFRPDRPAAAARLEAARHPPAQAGTRVPC